jgi:alkanesulfonate monooxygenase SsuD/methylene tetrahydromethanopterin reductase-like flavin-dependent oxidoreductase (luciferase family)
VEGRFLQAGDTAGLRAEATRADAEGVAAVFVSESVLGDPIVLAAGLAPLVPRVLLGARVEWCVGGRHPALLARDVTSLDLVCGGRSVLCFAPPFTEPLAEVISLCRALWLTGEAVHQGPLFPIQAAANRARPAGREIPPIALDLSSGEEVPPFLVGRADLLLWPTAATSSACRLERA